MIAALLALALSPQDPSVVQLGTVDVGGQQVVVDVPAKRGPFDDDTPHVEFDGWKFVVDLDGNIGVRYKSDGGWGEVEDAYPAAALKSVSAPEYRIKVFIITSATILEHGHDGVWRRRRGAIGEADKLTILKSLARLKALAETAADGRVRITFDVTVDDDLLFEKVEARSLPDDVRLLGRDLIRTAIAPRVSNDPFDNEEGIYNGPYSSVFVIHPARTRDETSDLIERTPATSVSWATFSDGDPGPSLSVLLFNAWKEHLHAAMLSDSGQYHSRYLALDRTGPYVFDQALPNLYLTRGNRLQHGSMDGEVSWSTPDESKFEDGSSIDSMPHLFTPDVEALVGNEDPPSNFAPRRFRFFRGDQASVVLVPLELADRFSQVRPDANAVGLVHWGRNLCGGGDQVGFIVDPSFSFESELDALGVEPPSIRAIPIAAVPETVGTVDFNPTGIGDFSVVIIEDPAEGRVLEVSESGSFRRWHAVLASTDHYSSLFRIIKDTSIQFKVSCNLNDAFMLQLITREYNEVNIALFGNSRLPAEIAGSRAIHLNVNKEPGPYWTEFKIKLPVELAGLDVVEISLGPPEFAGHYERFSEGKKSLKISQISFGPMTDTDPETTPTVDPDIKWLTTVQGPLDADATQRMTSLLQSDKYELRLNALGAMSRVRSEELLVEIAVHLNSIDESEAYLAFQAMRLIGTDEAWSNIAYVITKGPMGHNYRFAAESLAEKPEPATLQLMNGLMLNRNWRTRLAAVKTMANIHTAGAGVVASLVLTSDPDPVVRYEITKQKHSDHELFARRLLYAAVNDPYELVRTSSYLALLDSPFDNIRDQALRGVRDESVTIRLTILKAMRESPQAHYRPALQMAVVDSSPFVRAAALLAFATQPGDVVAGEIQNTFTDGHPAVKQALAALVKAKNITIPPTQ